MISESPYPTPYPDINTILEALLDGVKTILGDRFVGMVLGGSLVTGDFNPDRSDIDFLVITAVALEDDRVSKLHAMHEQLTAIDRKWGIELEGSYIPRQALIRYDPANAVHPHIERGEKLEVEHHGTDLLINMHVIRESGVALAGPDPKTVIAPVTKGEIRNAVVQLLSKWWLPMLEDPDPLSHDGYRAYAILTMCRMLFTLQYRAVISKTAAAQWALHTLDEQWSPLITQALAWPHGPQPDNLKETQAFIHYTVRSQQ